jgi:hypothetical protein
MFVSTANSGRKKGAHYARTTDSGKRGVAARPLALLLAGETEVCWVGERWHGSQWPHFPAHGLALGASPSIDDGGVQAILYE